jgi:ergothioneine biosynthesis protein EgtB
MELQTVSKGPAVSEASLAERYQSVRHFTEYLCETLVTEDYVVQTMTDVSPAKWHLAHTSWFFETFVLHAHKSGYRAFDERFAYLFNSYYVQAGERHCRDKRGYLSRPTVEEVYRYRAYVDDQMVAFLSASAAELAPEIREVVEIGLNHEQQHQELILTDIKHVLSVNPLRPVFRPLKSQPGHAPDLEWVGFEEGVYEIGHDGEGFHFDNEGPRHPRYQTPFEIASRPVTNEEYIAFIEDGGYRRPELWLSLGWAAVQQHNWTEPFYWERQEETWRVFTLAGMRDVNEAETATHLSLFEADAYARWAGARLPTEFEWEIASRIASTRGNFADEGLFHVRAASHDEGPLRQMFGNAWEWTRSQYDPYPGYNPAPGAIGEYNGKWMCNQFVLRGGSCATHSTHIRRTYRNFFHPDACWQFTCIRLARDV